MYNPQTEILGKNKSRYTLVMVVAKRARQIVAGSPLKIDEEESNPITAALLEVKENKIKYDEANVSK